ncbi:MAG: hypothetical protein ACJ72W_02775 [Actinoallomurus sp.]
MKTTTKVTGLTLAGLATAGVAIAAIGAGPSTTVARNVGQSRPYTASSNAGQTAVEHSDTARHRARPTVVALTSRYAVRNVRMGHSVAVLRKVGNRWRVVGALRATDRRVRGATVLVRRQTTVVAVLGRHAVTLVVPPRAVVVVADNGRIGVVGWRFLRLVMPMTPTPTPTPTDPTTPPMTPPTVAPTPASSGSQAPVVGGLKGRVSTKW